MGDQATGQSNIESLKNQSFKIKVDGQEMEVTGDELIELAQKGKDYTHKTQELAEKEKTLKADEARVAGLKAIVDEMEANPKLKEVLNKVYTDFKSGKISKSDEIKDRNLKLIDKRIEEATDPETKENLREIRDIIKQEAPTEDVEKLKDKIAQLETDLANIKNATLIGQTDRIEAHLSELSEEFGKELVDKYKKDIIAISLKYPNNPIKKLFYHFADDAEIEAALLNKAKKKEQDELDRKKRGSEPSGIGITATTPLAKDKAGRVTRESLLARIRERLGQS